MSAPEEWRGAARRFALGLSTLLGLGRRGTFIPYRHGPAPEAAAAGYRALEPLFERRLAAFSRVLDAVDGFAAELTAIGPPARFDQDWFAPLDAAVAYALVRTFAPARIVEVGSGHSTRFLARAIADGRLDTRLFAIDPEPRATLPEGVAWIRAPLQDAGGAATDGLGAGDVLFVDSSHVLAPGSDVDLVLNDILPRLPPGALVHVHDIFLPDAYPSQWRWRGYNEQQAMAALLHGGGYELVFASRFAERRLAGRLAHSVVASLPRAKAARASSLWLRKVGAP